MIIAIENPFALQVTFNPLMQIIFNYVNALTHQIANFVELII